MKDYEAAGKALEDTIDEYSAPAAYARLLPYVELIYVEKLKNYDKAIAIYGKIKSNLRDPKVINLLEQVIGKLEKKRQSVNN